MPEQPEQHLTPRAHQPSLSPQTLPPSLKLVEYVVSENPAKPQPTHSSSDGTRRNMRAPKRVGQEDRGQRVGYHERQHQASRFHPHLRLVPPQTPNLKMTFPAPMFNGRGGGNQPLRIQTRTATRRRKRHCSQGYGDFRRQRQAR